MGTSPLSVNYLNTLLYNFNKNCLLTGSKALSLSMVLFLVAVPVPSQEGRKS